MKQHIGTEWEGYRNACVSADAGPEQLKDTQCAFYGGALAFYSLLMSKVENGPTDEPSEADLTLMRDIHEELLAFAKELSGNS